MNDNHRPMSPLGSALFDMLADMKDAQARVYQNGGSHAQAAGEIERLESLHRPRVLLTIKRVGK